MLKLSHQLEDLTHLRDSDFQRPKTRPEDFACVPEGLELPAKMSYVFKAQLQQPHPLSTLATVYIPGSNRGSNHSGSPKVLTRKDCSSIIVKDPFVAASSPSNENLTRLHTAVDMIDAMLTAGTRACDMLQRASYQHVGNKC
jgi:hypothetical protein